MKPVRIDESNALRISVEFVIDRVTGNYRWNTRGMSSPHDLTEQDLIFRTMHDLVQKSIVIEETKSQAVN